MTATTDPNLTLTERQLEGIVRKQVKAHDDQLMDAIIADIQSRVNPQYAETFTAFEESIIYNNDLLCIDERRELLIKMYQIRAEQMLLLMRRAFIAGTQVNRARR